MKAVRDWTKQDEKEHSSFYRVDPVAWEAGWAYGLKPSGAYAADYAVVYVGSEDDPRSWGYSAYCEGYCGALRVRMRIFGRAPVRRRRS